MACGELWEEGDGGVSVVVDERSVDRTGAGDYQGRMVGFPRALAELTARLGRPFTNEAWLIEAMTHSTFANEHPHAGPANERLEFLGDAVLDLLAARLLFDRFSNEMEGELTRRRARVVRREALAVMAQDLELGTFLRVGEGQRKGVVSDRVLADAYEALVGAVFMDGGFAAVEQCFAAAFTNAIDMAAQPIDFKTILQEVCHTRAWPLPDYRVVAVTGPDHARAYTCEVRVSNAAKTRATAPNKRDAEQECARQALLEVGSAT